MEKLVDVWDVEFKESLVSISHKGTGAHEQETPARLENANREEAQEELGSTSRARQVRILASAQFLENEEGRESDNNMEQVERNSLQLDQDAEQILDGIAGEPGIGRRLMESWGTSITNYHAERREQMTMIINPREAQRARLAEVLREVDVWLENKDEDVVSQLYRNISPYQSLLTQGLVLRRSRQIFEQHLDMRMALIEAHDLVSSLREAHSKLMNEKREMERINHEELMTATEELGRLGRLVEQLTTCVC